MDPAAAQHLVHAYVQGWRAGDRAKILGTLAPDCVIVESYGPPYTGVDKISRWIDTWLGAGNTVDRWEVTSLEVTATGTACFFEWSSSAPSLAPVPASLEPPSPGSATTASSHCGNTR
jgi:ketosteroid isomerase-like protein